MKLKKFELNETNLATELAMLIYGINIYVPIIASILIALLQYKALNKKIRVKGTCAFITASILEGTTKIEDLPKLFSSEKANEANLTIEQQLEELNSLKEKGLLTDEEYESKKRQMLGI